MTKHFFLTKNLFDQKNTLIAYTGELPSYFDPDALKNVYGYAFTLQQVDSVDDVPDFDGSTVFISQEHDMKNFDIPGNVDFYVRIHEDLGSVIVVNGSENDAYVGAIQHVRRRETIAMTPANSFAALQTLVDQKPESPLQNTAESKNNVIRSIQEITATQTKALLGSCGLSVQYAIMMGLIDEAQEQHPGKQIKIIVPPNCYGGTNDQARRVAACLENVDVMDLPVDGDNDMVQSTDIVLEKVAQEDAVPYIIAEIPTNPRVEVPVMEDLRAVLSKKRQTANGDEAIDPVFILDQTFCPNIQFLSNSGILSSIRTISYVSGSKFPSGGKCTAGYLVANEKAADLMGNIEKHLKLCDNEATDLQVAILEQQIPSMLQRIKDAYKNTREFVTFINTTLPSAKINFVSEALAEEGFTPSVFSLDLPTKGDTEEEREAYKRKLNQKLIDMMIGQIPNESKYYVSYGQLKGC